jgi:hypothetical protein
LDYRLCIRIGDDLFGREGANRARDDLADVFAGFMEARH